jgi:hypothetical protein
MSVIISSDFEDVDTAQYAISEVTSNNLNIINADIIPKNAKRPQSGIVYLNALDSTEVYSNRALGNDQNYTGLTFMPTFLSLDEDHHTEIEMKSGCVLKLVVNEDDAPAVKESLYSNGASNVRFSK